ncbi:MAG: sigma-70 family RNA polymerase sigma factor [Chloroflexi bacterium]|jgi:RNA polymerase primary sigma factor|nr:sigma-70 family RNA polymerase sigma factor [Chloroflexota bacterium]
MLFSGEGGRAGEVLSALLEIAEVKGFITDQDIREFYTGESEYELWLPRIRALLQRNGIPFHEADLPPIESLEEDILQPAPGIPSLETGDIEDTVSLYLKETAHVPLLTEEEEVRLAQCIELGQLAEQELRQPDARPSAERRSELERLRQQGHQAREKLIKANTRLVVSIARRYVGRGVPFLDLIQEGNLGLMKAVEKYEYRRGFRFSTYATWWIRQSVSRAVADQSRTIRVPVHMTDRLRLLYRATQEMEQELGRTPDIEELAARLETTPSKVRWLLQIAQPVLSLESPVGDDDEGELGQYVEDENTPSPAQAAYENMLRERIDEVLASLSPREGRVLRMRFGLGNNRAHTLEEVGQKFGLTRERIRQIEGRALRRLRHPSLARILRDS